MQFAPTALDLTLSAPHERSSLDLGLHSLQSALLITSASEAGQSGRMRLTRSTIALLAAAAAAEPVPRAVKAPTVDLGYAVYEGSLDAINSINAFKGCVVMIVISTV